METNEKITNLKNEISKDIENITSLKEIQDLKVKYLGKKGLVTELTSNMKDLSPEERKELGMVVNEVRNFVTDLITNKIIRTY